MNTAKVSSKSQITLPSWVRKRLGITPGANLLLRIEGQRLVIERADSRLESLRGSLPDVYGDPDDYVRDLRTEWQHRS